MCPGELKADVNETLEAFEHILHLYRSGLHLDELPPSEFTGNSSGGWRGEGWRGALSFHSPFFLSLPRNFQPPPLFSFRTPGRKKKKKGSVFFRSGCFDRFIRQLE